MAEPFKNLFNEEIIRIMADHLMRVSPGFDSLGFIAFAIKDLDKLELKQRSSQITDALERFLPKDFPTAVKMLVASLDPRTDLSISDMENAQEQEGIRGWSVMPMADYVARHGQHNLEMSLNALREMTIRFSSEFAIRHFIKSHEAQVVRVLSKWVDDPNYHVRRLVSEGARPRLPWGMQLSKFIQDPSPVLPLLEKLKNDSEEYVRRSVANNLNDMSKDHPDLVADLAKKWMIEATPERKKLIRHALRSLIKSGHVGALETLGYGPPKLKVSKFIILTPKVMLGTALEFDLEIFSDSVDEQSLVIDYVVHHMRANGKTTAKVFKWKTIKLKGGAQLCAHKSHPMRVITTRRYYPGKHRIEVSINGEIIGGGEFVFHTGT